MHFSQPHRSPVCCKEKSHLHVVFWLEKWYFHVFHQARMKKEHNMFVKDLTQLAPFGFMLFLIIPVFLLYINIQVCQIREFAVMNQI